MLTVQFVHWTKSLVRFVSLYPPVKSGPGQSVVGAGHGV
jgi:hypothetical protein